MDNCYNCENLTIEEHKDYEGYEIYYNLDCKYCDMRIKNHARPCENHKVGIPTKIVYDAEKD